MGLTQQIEQTNEELLTLWAKKLAFCSAKGWGSKQHQQGRDIQVLKPKVYNLMTSGQWEVHQQ